MKFTRGETIQCNKKDDAAEILKQGVICVVNEPADENGNLEVVVKGGNSRIFGPYVVEEKNFDYVYPELHKGIEPGYVCVLRGGDMCEVKVVEHLDGREEMILSERGGFYTNYDEKLKFYQEYGDIMEIYGYASEVEWTDEIATNYRELKWSRPEEPKK